MPKLADIEGKSFSSQLGLKNLCDVLSGHKHRVVEAKNNRNCYSARMPQSQLTGEAFFARFSARIFLSYNAGFSAQTLRPLGLTLLRGMHM